MCKRYFPQIDLMLALDNYKAVNFHQNCLIFILLIWQYRAPGLGLNLGKTLKTFFLLHADDIVLLAENETDLKHILKVYTFTYISV